MTISFFQVGSHFILLKSKIQKVSFWVHLGDVRYKE